MKKIEKGFTLLELLLSMGILMILISILTSIFGAIVDSQLESKATSSVDQDGRYLLARLTRDVKSASTIVTPATPGQQSTTLQITVNSINYTYGLDGNGNLQLTNNNGTDNLNSSDASISAMTFTRIGSGGSNDTVRVSFTVASRTQRVSGPEVKSFQNNPRKTMRGQALITLLFFMIVAITITSAGAVILVVNSVSGTKFQQGSIAYDIANSGAENALLRLLRDPNYTGETLSVGGGSVVIQVTSVGSNYTILSQGTIGNFIRQIQMTATYSNNLLTVTSQQEIF